MNRIKKLSLGEKIILLSFFVGIITLFLPWVDFKLLKYNGFHEKGFIPLICFIYPTFKILRAEKYDSRIGITLGALAIIITVILKSKYQIEEYGMLYDASALGIYIFLIASIVFTFGNYLLSKENGEEIISSRFLKDSDKKIDKKEKEEIKSKREIRREKRELKKIEESPKNNTNTIEEELEEKLNIDSEDIKETENKEIEEVSEIEDLETFEDDKKSKRERRKELKEKQKQRREARESQEKTEVEIDKKSLDSSINRDSIFDEIKDDLESIISQEEKNNIAYDTKKDLEEITELAKKDVGKI